MFEFGDYYYYYCPHFCRLKTLKITYSYFLISPVRKTLLLRCCWWNLIPSRRKDTRALVKKLYNPLFFPTTTHLYNHACQIINEIGQFRGKLLHTAELSCSAQAPVMLSLWSSFCIFGYTMKTEYTNLGIIIIIIFLTSAYWKASKSLLNFSFRR